MAVFLTLGLIGVVTGAAGSAGALALLFGLQFGVGTAVGVGVGRRRRGPSNRVQLEHAGLYPVLVLAVGLLAFGLAAVLGGSGFLAVYLAGLVLGEAPLVARRGIFLFHDAVAWLSQIALFVMLGMLSFPTRLLAVAGPALAVALVLIVVARPLSVALVALPFRFTPRETGFLAWGGLKGAVPITLATFPLTAGVEGGAFLFDVVFFVVLVSALTQGWSLPAVARRLGLALPAEPAAPALGRDPRPAPRRRRHRGLHGRAVGPGRRADAERARAARRHGRHARAPRRRRHRPARHDRAAPRRPRLRRAAAQPAAAHRPPLRPRRRDAAAGRRPRAGVLVGEHARAAAPLFRLSRPDVVRDAAARAARGRGRLAPRPVPHRRRHDARAGPADGRAGPEPVHAAAGAP